MWQEWFSKTMVWRSTTILTWKTPFTVFVCTNIGKWMTKRQNQVFQHTLTSPSQLYFMKIMSQDWRYKQRMDNGLVLIPPLHPFCSSQGMRSWCVSIFDLKHSQEIQQKINKFIAKKNQLHSQWWLQYSFLRGSNKKHKLFKI